MQAYHKAYLSVAISAQFTNIEISQRMTLIQIEQRKATMIQTLAWERKRQDRASHPPLCMPRHSKISRRLLCHLDRTHFQERSRRHPLRLVEIVAIGRTAIRLRDGQDGLRPLRGLLQTARSRTYGFLLSPLPSFPHRTPQLSI